MTQNLFIAELGCVSHSPYYFARDTVVALSALAGGFLWIVSPALNFICAFVFGLAGTAYFLAYCEEA